MDDIGNITALDEDLMQSDRYMDVEMGLGDAPVAVVGISRIRKGTRAGDARPTTNTVAYALCPRCRQLRLPNKQKSLYFAVKSGLFRAIRD